MFAPFGGLDEIRRRALDTLDLRPGSSVLELGCGPGDVTAALVARRVRVDAVDRSAAMLRVAEERVPDARFERADLRRYVPHSFYDAVLLSFVLHEVPPSDVVGLIDRATSALEPHGRLAILDHALPYGAAGWQWHTVLRAVESSSIDAWLDLDLNALMAAKQLEIEHDLSLAGGRARMLVVRRPL